ncbi:unnamed protein product [Rotaria sordida]|uniref:t-SNARE coiled-coil homology domain-containing protein n=1 Tax=Rotaria sordida TaxID=392033 RepID=A0A819YQN3_9BILA|nr:unnamed protein product [Rotaria sordida]CAF1314236.1 unnamed protein product [Rotaria sordida]CAF3696509.1 unnamed protein product [Rotaria sordida]CAF4161994.1 unnamed protein product [Rotaria sordida]
MSNEHELELLHRRDAILHETMDLTSNVVQSLEQQQKLAFDTKENLYNQNLLLSLANDKMRSMNQDLTSVVNEMNEIDAHHGCLCCNMKKSKKKKFQQQNDSKTIIISNTNEKTLETIKNSSSIPQIIDNNKQEKKIVDELNQMRNQLIIFQDQVKIINKSLEEGDEIIHQLGNETNQYMHAITTALNKAEQVLGRKFIVNQQQQAMARE